MAEEKLNCYVTDIIGLLASQSMNPHLSFGDFELNYGLFELTRRGRAVKLERLPMELLMLLIQNRDKLVSRKDVGDKLWGGDVFVDLDASINTAVLKLRRALQDDPKNPAFIRTVGRMGYRFIAAVTDVSPAGPSVPEQLPARRVMLVVLPFENLSRDPEQEYFSDGLTEETICHLGRVNPHAMGVIARTSAMSYKRTQKSVLQIGRELGVDYLLESSVRREGSQVRVTSQLIRIQDQTHIWAANFDSDISSLLQLQNEMGTAIAEQVRVKLLPKRAKPQSAPEELALNQDAYDLYLRGRRHWNTLTKLGIWKAIEFFEQAVALEPDFALAWCGMADCYSMLPVTCDEPVTEILPKALAAARRALAIDDSLAEAHTSLGTVKTWMEWDWPGAEACLRLALEINPSYVQAHRYYACLLSHTGRHVEAAEQMRKAREVDPLSPIMHALSGHLRWHARDYEAALAHLRDAQAINNELWIVHTFLGRVFDSQGRLVEALAEFQKAFDLSGGSSVETIAFRARLQALNGDRQSAENAILMLNEMSNRRYVPPCLIAAIYQGLGDVDKALTWLEQAYKARDVRLVFLQADPRWDPLRSEKRFHDLIRQMKLLPAVR